ncbi:unnamed protein product [Caenorhabditis sp. 36 PRJEB53466]|nr:unnamed protein product [Caenorhabditis sp. 36 PRJEB53466]
MEWNTLSVPAKQFILGYLKYSERCNLKLCSRSDRALVDSTKYVADCISIEEQRDGGNSRLILSFEDYTIKLTEEDNVIKIERTGEMESVNGNKYDAARRILERMSDRGTIAAREILVRNTSLKPSEHWILKCERLEIRMVGEERQKCWLQKTIPNLKKLKLIEWGIEGILDLPQKYVEQGRPGDGFQLRFASGNGFRHEEMFEKQWNVEKVECLDPTNGEYLYLINGGFSNFHGVTKISRVIVHEFSTHFVFKEFSC